MLPGGDGCYQVVTDATRWFQVVLGGARLYQVEPGGNRWYQVVPISQFFKIKDFL